MIVLDASAVVAVLAGEPEGEAFVALIVDDGSARISAATFLEAGIVLASDGFRRPAIDDSYLDDFIARTGTVVEPVTHHQALIARAAFRRFGKGTGHPAGLNFGDCFSYALARSLDAPLLFKGEDFARTDIRSALA